MKCNVEIFHLVHLLREWIFFLLSPSLRKWKTLALEEGFQKLCRERNENEIGDCGNGERVSVRVRGVCCVCRDSRFCEIKRTRFYGRSCPWFFGLFTVMPLGYFIWLCHEMKLLMKFNYDKWQYACHASVCIFFIF